ncbi:polyisoprenoid-binding protein [bacterium]|nr:MAG: polyisoprenoid-binding protein [bacterium]
MKTRFTTLFAIAVLSVTSVFANNNEGEKAAQKWSFDKSHSAITFSVRHIFTPVVGQFNDFNGDVYFDATNLKGSSIDVTIEVASIDTKNEKRDGHLQSPDFFDAAQFGKMTFKSSEIVSKGNNEFIAKGVLTIKDVSKTIELPFQLLGSMDHPFMKGTKVAAFESSIKLNRNDYKVGAGNWAETAIVGDEVDVKITLEMMSAK